MRFFLLREAKNESQQTLSNKTGGIVTDQSISNFEVGKTKRMQPKIWQAIAVALNMSVEDLNQAVYGETIVMAVPVKLGDYVLQLIEKSKQEEPAKHSPAAARTLEDLLDGGVDHPKPSPGGENVLVEKKKVKRQDTTSGSAR